MPPNLLERNTLAGNDRKNEEMVDRRIIRWQPEVAMGK